MDLWWPPRTPTPRTPTQDQVTRPVSAARRPSQRPPPHGNPADEHGDEESQPYDTDTASSGSQESDEMSILQGSHDLAGDTPVSPGPGHTQQPPDLDWKNLEYLHQVPDELFCGICKTPFHKPVATSCGHVFCFSCLDRLLLTAEAQSRVPCPMCRNMLEFDSRPDGEPLAAQVSHPCSRPLIDMLDNARVRCPNRAGACGWSGPRSAVEKHVRRDCNYTMVPCALSSCPEMVLRGSVRIAASASPAQDRDCLHHEGPCDHCRHRVYQAQMYDHLQDECIEGPKPQCEACGERVAREELVAHTVACWPAPVPCRFASAGCTESRPRRRIGGHERACLYGMVQRLSERVGAHEVAAAAAERDNRRLHQQLGEACEAAAAAEARQAQLEQAVAELREEAAAERLAGDLRQLEKRLNLVAEDVRWQRNDQHSFVVGEVSAVRQEMMELRSQVNSTGTLVRWLTIQMQDLPSRLRARVASSSGPGSNLSGAADGGSNGGGGGGGNSDNGESGSGSASMPSGTASGSGLRPRTSADGPRPSL